VTPPSRLLLIRALAGSFVGFSTVGVLAQDDPPTGEETSTQQTGQGEQPEEGAADGEASEESEAGDPARIDPVRVTARRWLEYAQDVPGSVTVVDKETLRDAAVSNVREAGQYVPNLFFTEFSSRRLSFPTLRSWHTSDSLQNPADLTTRPHQQASSAVQKITTTACWRTRPERNWSENCGHSTCTVAALTPGHGRRSWTIWQPCPGTTFGRHPMRPGNARPQSKRRGPCIS